MTLSVLAENEDHANRLVFEAMSQTKGIQPKKRRRRKGQAEDAAPLESPEVSVVGVQVGPAQMAKVAFGVDWSQKTDWSHTSPVACDAENSVKDVMEPDASA